MQLLMPDMNYVEELQRFKQDFLSAGEGSNTCGSLAKYETIQEWINEVFMLSAPETAPTGKTPRKQYIYLREEDDKIIGFLQIRFCLNEYLEKYAGHIGYCICPSERCKGYASQLLHDALPLCKSLGINRVSVCCDPNNEGSKKTILNNGGTYESTVYDSKNGTYINRYWI